MYKMLKNVQTLIPAAAGRTKKSYLCLLVYPVTSILIFSVGHLIATHQLNLVGYINDQGSIATHTTSFIDTLHDTLPINLYTTKPCSLNGFPAYYNTIMRKSIECKNICRNKRLLSLSGITIFTDFILDSAWHLYRCLPQKNTLRIAHSVTERTKLPPEWVARLNNNFDAVIVPDPWLLDVFKTSGVHIPVFALPLVLDLDRLYAKKLKTHKNSPFVFGFSGTFIPRKNQLTLVQAFVEEFGNDPHVKLIIHGRYAKGFEDFFAKCNAIKTDNIIIRQTCFSRTDYEHFISSLDCYVTASKGEGFSIVPYEALAAGVPCILSNNTAQKTICDAGLVRPIAAHIKEPSVCLATGEVSGYDFGCNVNDVRSALRDMYQNYEHYLAKTEAARSWTRSVTAQGLKERYRSLIDPKMIILGLHNAITESYIMTNSPALFEKLKLFFNAPSTILCVKK